MKKILLLFAIAGMFLFACKKEHSSTTSPLGKKYKVSFNVTNFAQQHTGFSLGHHPAVNALGDTVSVKALNLLYFYVFDSNGNRVTRVIQDSTMADMGMVADSLPAGTYNVVAIAGQKGLITGNDDSLAPTAFFGYGGFNWQDTFFGRLSLTVSDQNISKDITLGRTIAKLDVKLLDAIPNSANTLSLSIIPEYSDIALGSTPGSPHPTNTGTVDSGKHAITIPVSAKGTTNFAFGMFVSNTSKLMEAHIVCRDASNHIIASAVVENVHCTVNQKTILSGNLFGGVPGSSPQSFTVKVDTAWGNTTHIGF